MAVNGPGRVLARNNTLIDNQSDRCPVSEALDKAFDKIFSEIEHE